MLYISTDKEYGYVSSLIHEDFTTNVGTGPFITHVLSEAREGFDGENKYVFDETILELDTALFNDILLNYNDYCYDTQRGFRFRPAFTIEVVDGVVKDGTYIVPINTPFELRIIYNDPDNVGYLDKLDTIKLKDRATFISIPEEFQAISPDKFDPITKTCTIPLKSSFPGISYFRAKDTKLLCQFHPATVKYIVTS